VQNEASITSAKPNRALEPFGILIGKWKTVGKHPYFPDAMLHGRASFEWIEDGAFILMRSAVDHPKFPKGIAIIGSDDATDVCTMLYFDERGVSRTQHITLRENVLEWWRNSSEFSQRFRCEIAADGKTMVGKGEMSKEGGAWEGDLDLTFERRESHIL
jgi:hypothetical protein